MKGRECTVCGIYKTIENFYKSEVTACIPCKRERAKRYRTSEKGLKSAREYARTRYRKHRIQHLARSTAKYAVKSGKIIKPKLCSSCGEKRKLDAHHEDYSKPLDVIWLCDVCHKHQHGFLVDPRLLKKVTQ